MCGDGKEKGDMNFEAGKEKMEQLDAISCEAGVLFSLKGEEMDEQDWIC